jgi:hypothetical protein
MIQGVLQTKSKQGVVGIILLILAPVIIFGLRINPSEYLVTEYAKTSYLTGKMFRLNAYMAHIFEPSGNDKFYLFSAIGIKVQIFIAFCYTYHYLNWFSKTTVIGWGKALFAKKFVVTIIIWCASVLLYWYDNKTGFIALIFPEHCSCCPGISAQYKVGKRNFFQNEFFQKNCSITRIVCNGVTIEINCDKFLQFRRPADYQSMFH